MNKNHAPSVEKVPVITHENGHDTVPTVGTFRKKLIELETALRRNTRADFDVAEWLNNTEDNSDGAVYARMLDDFGSDNQKQLKDYQVTVLQYVENQIDFNQKQAALNLSDEQIPASAVVLADNLGKARELAPEKSRETYEGRIAAALYTAEQLKPGNTLPKPTGKALAAFVKSSESDPKSKTAKTTQKELFQQMTRMHYVATTYGMLAKEQQGADNSQYAEIPARTEKQQEVLDEATADLDTLRDKLATLYAKREKRMWGHDGIVGEARHNQNNKELHAEYTNASRKVFGLLNPNFLKNETLTTVDRIRMIAEHTVEEAKKLDLATLESYKNTNTKFGKLLEKYGRLHVVPKVVLGVGVSATAAVLSGGWGAAPVSGTLMAAGFNARQRKKRAEGADMLDLDADTIVEKYGHVEDIDLAFDGIDSRIRTNFEDRINKAQAKTGKYTLGSFAVAGALSAGAHMLPGGLFDGSHGLLHHDAAANTVTPPHVAPEVVQPLPDNVMALHTGMSSISADPGMGMYEAAHRAGFEISQSDLLRAAPDLYRYHLAYPMADGLPGIPISGPIPQASIDILRYFATHH